MIEVTIKLSAEDAESRVDAEGLLARLERPILLATSALFGLSLAIAT